jgi:hypothetical protein
MNNINIYQKKFENERSYLFCINTINVKNMYKTTYSDHFRNYSNFIFDDYNQKESCARLSKLTTRAENHRKELLINKLKKNNNFISNQLNLFFQYNNLNS